MRASEIVAALQSMIAEYGDQKVLISALGHDFLGETDEVYKHVNNWTELGFVISGSFLDTCGTGTDDW